MPRALRHAGRMRLFAALLPPDRVTAELLSVREQLRTRPHAERLRWTERDNWHLTLAFYGEVAERRFPELCARLARAAARSRPLTLCVAGGGRFGDRVLWAGIADASGTGTGAGARPDAGAERKPPPGPEREREREPESAPGPVPAPNGRAGNGQHGPGARTSDAPDAVRALHRLADAAHAAGRRSGLALDERPRFHAHVTLAHSRGRTRGRSRRRGGPGAGEGAGEDGTRDRTSVDLRPYADDLAAFVGVPWTATELALMRSTLPTSGVPGGQPRYEQLAAWPLGG